MAKKATRGKSAKSEESAYLFDGSANKLDNMRIWNQWCDNTPKHALKQFNRPGGFKGTAIDPTYRFERLTELFGPHGVGWGFTITQRWRERHPTSAWDNSSGVGVKVEVERVVCFIAGHIWFIDPATGERHQTSEAIGGTTSDGFAPDELWKKSQTDAALKCCQFLGLAADIYSGQQDGNKYADAHREADQSTPRQPRDQQTTQQRQQKASKEADKRKPPKQTRPAQQAIDTMLARLGEAKDAKGVKPIADWWKKNKTVLNDAENTTFIGLFKTLDAKFKKESTQGGEQ